MGQTRHAKTKIHINFRLKREAEEEEEEEEARQLEVEYMRERKIPDEQTEFELAAERWTADEAARLDAEFDAWNEAQQACRLGCKNREEKAPPRLEEQMQHAKFYTKFRMEGYDSYRKGTRCYTSNEKECDYGKSEKGVKP